MKTFLTIFKQNPLPILVMVVGFLFLIYVVIDDTFTTKEITTAIVLKKHYVPETRQSQLYTNANNQTTTHYYYDNEKFLIMAQKSYNKVYTVYYSPELYYHKIAGDNITIKIKRGILSNSVVKVEALQ